MDPQRMPPLETGAPAPTPRDAALEAARLEDARRRLAALKGFYVHLIVFALVIAGLLVINSLTGGPWWVALVFLGWGLGVLAHGLALVARRSRALAAWEQRKVAAYLAEDGGGPAASRHDPNRPT